MGSRVAFSLSSGKQIGVFHDLRSGRTSARRLLGNVTLAIERPCVSPQCAPTYGISPGCVAGVEAIALIGRRLPPAGSAASEVRVLPTVEV
jgi:hypothetical protein